MSSVERSGAATARWWTRCGGRRSRRTLQVAEGAPKKGAERAQRFRGALSEASEAAAAVEALLRLGQVPAAPASAVLDRLAHLVAMLTRLLHAPR